MFDARIVHNDAKVEVLGNLLAGLFTDWILSISLPDTSSTKYNQQQIQPATNTTSNKYNQQQIQPATNTTSNKSN